MSKSICGRTIAVTLCGALMLSTANAAENLQEEPSRIWQERAAESAAELALKLAKAFPELESGDEAPVGPFLIALKNTGFGKASVSQGSPRGGGQRADADREEKEAGAQSGGQRQAQQGRRISRGRGTQGTADREFAMTIDADKNGAVTGTEISEAVLAAVVAAFEPRSSLDTDADGQISKKEYAVSMPYKFGEVDESGMDGHARGHFRREDFNGDGVLSMDEVADRSMGRVASRIVSMQLAVRIARADADNDGVLTREELHAVCAKPLSDEVWAALGGQDGSIRLDTIFGTLGRIDGEIRMMLDKQL